VHFCALSWRREWRPGDVLADAALREYVIGVRDTAQVQYQTATNLYQKAVNMFRTALGARQS